MFAVFEDAELVAQAKIDRAASELLRGKRRGDFDFSFCNVSMDVDVREDHLLGVPFHPSDDMFNFFNVVAIAAADAVILVRHPHQHCGYLLSLEREV